jgi:hypothetical protein
LPLSILVKNGKFAGEFPVGRTGFEPVTLGLKVRAEPRQQTALS